MASSSNFPNRPFRLEQRNWVAGQQAWNAGNSNLIHTELWIFKNSYSPTYNFGTSSYEIYISGNKVGGNNFTFDFRNSDQLLLHASDNWYGADGNGNCYYTVDAYCNAATLGYTETHEGVWAPRIIRPPGAPFSYPNAASALTEITATSMRYTFSGTTDGGSNIDGWQIDYSTTSNFAAGTVTTIGSWGTSVVTGLIPGTQYWFRARGHNAAGWGAYSDVATAKTLASVRVSDGTSWLAPQVLCSTGTAWVSPGVLISQSGAWVNPLP
ncbi:hypothetical protein QDW19_gp21 [Microbacterium phage AvGardian]|uniref:hypothetical protein n=1 Tax=Microbacterium phage AvGardian TaxID=2725619 RepID=UPI001463AC6E|nr:hypothetical protein QDW19_gp21 [Microbacterium phage AvGardian]QJD49836.1 hypothetical protein SEA_AVGARDIAN_21 [Microbacterium phage AvGardian]